MTRAAKWLPWLVLLLLGCEATPTGESIAPGAEDPDEGKSFFAPAAEPDAKEDSLLGQKGLPVTADRTDTAVWEVKNAWEDADTAEARKAGVAWGEDSGLDWNEKYALWVKSMPRVDGEWGYPTYEMTTPYGKKLPAPAIECAETAIFLRATFASWYALPFFLEATDARGKRLYLGHFGFRTADGRYADSPRFKALYADHSSKAGTWQTEGWPQDAKLRGRKLGGSQDDYQPFLFEGARAGAYFDEAFLNKRVGYFMIFALSYFGSINLADPKNTFNITPEGIREGDVLIERWQRRGIGHTLVVKNVEKPVPDVFAVELVSGSMPRRQAKWDTAQASRNYLTLDYTGGPGVGADGVPYAKLGGGIKRWRSAKKIDGRWVNVVTAPDRAVFIDANDTAKIAARPGRFGEILREVGPEEKREVLIAQIDDARDHLRRFPASCSARIRREEAFSALYDLESDAFGRTRSAVDAELRELEDYVFAELEYTKSKTCCWNSSTAAMYDIAMRKASEDVADHTAGECRAPTVFMNRDGGYQAFADYAASIGRASEWKPWSEDEPCAQRDVVDDTEAEHEWTPWCEVGEALLAVE
jgi:hypothetical protein